ncbi:LysR family transcriptional regulator [Verrucomicrobiaceae bacterium 5K15]|uniref:LysR family transcriptional regulator n=1 Tax=Oceaniferula flava TaxID=2800421 RepID=A0AAE2SAM7_9BACT|nr:LysR family transcriptional regulator [Oceaniferula flavus]MBK1854149.1 LysR family transcriptional regulator [Oceaniferula flavus]MBM1135455.1 LysR family transcriptional regulator [Oceaniferula flavus]
MDFLNYHHLRYFWTVARTGSVRQAAEDLGVSQPSISAQLKLLEESFGEKLFHRSGRKLVLTEAGQIALTYADEIFSAGRELTNAISQGSNNRATRLNVGMTDSLSKLIAYEILKPAYQYSRPTHVVSRQGELAVLIHQLQAHRLDLVLADEPATTSLKTKTYNHRLGRSGVTFCATPQLAAKLRRGFPQSLHGAPALLPSDNMGMRWALEAWFDKQGVRPQLVGEFEDSTLMEVAAAGGLGFTTVPTVVDQAALKHYGLKVIAKVEECGSDFYAITGERLVKHPLAKVITENAYSHLFAESPEPE